jgi:hypothetical protein
MTGLFIGVGIIALLVFASVLGTYLSDNDDYDMME